MVDEDLPTITESNDPPPGEDGPFAPGGQVEHFRIVCEIGHGGMCFVYKALDGRLNRVVALKVLRPSLARDERIARMFHDECVGLANFDHPNLVPVFETFHHPPQPPCYTMPFIQGHSVRQLVRRNGPMPPRQAVRIVLEACKALAYVHKRDVIHRDITPGNVMIEEGSGRVRVVDFGIAVDLIARLAQDAEATNLSFGTLSFMSPEQTRGEGLDPRTDIFSLGMTLYHMLTASAAYKASSRLELDAAFRHQRPAPPSRLNPQVNAKLDAAVMKMIAVRRSDRYTNCEGLAVDLEKALDGQPAPGGAPARPRSRARLAFAGTALAIIALLAALLVGRPWRPAAPAGSPASSAPGGVAGDGKILVTPPPGGEVEITVRPAASQGAPPPEPPAASTAPAPLTWPTVRWVYQSDPQKGFDDPGALRGTTVLDGSTDSLHSGMYAFAPGGGLAPCNGPELQSVDFRITAEGTAVILSCDSPNHPGCVVRSSQAAFKDPIPPRAGYRPLSGQELKAGTVLYFQCAKGGHAKMLVPSRPASGSPGP